MTHSNDTTLATEGQQPVTEVSTMPTNETNEQSNASQRLIYQHLSHGHPRGVQMPDDTN